MTTLAPPRAGNPDLRRQYRREITEALKMGAPKTEVAQVVAAFAGQHPDLDDLRCALQQCVSPRKLAALEGQRVHRRKGRLT